jgi:hypothetical protein
VVAADVHRALPPVWPATVPLHAHAPAQRYRAGAGGVLNTVLWPEFQEINAALTEYLAQVTDKVIRDEVYGDTGDADEVPEPAKIGR